MFNNDKKVPYVTRTTTTIMLALAARIDYECNRTTIAFLQSYQHMLTESIIMMEIQIVMEKIIKVEVQIRYRLL